MSEIMTTMTTLGVDTQAIAAQLLAQAGETGVELVGPNGLLNQLTKQVLESALEAEMDDHLGYEKHQVEGCTGGNSRNGVRTKMVLTEIGPVQIEVPRDTDASFTPDDRHKAATPADRDRSDHPLADGEGVDHW